MASEKYYIEIKKGQKDGPYSIDELTDKINLNTLVWHEGMSEWKKASEVDTLSSVLKKIPPPLPKDDTIISVLHEKGNKYKGRIMLFLLFFPISFVLSYYIFGGFTIDSYEKSYIQSRDTHLDLWNQIDQLNLSKEQAHERFLELAENEDSNINFTLVKKVSLWAGDGLGPDFNSARKLIPFLATISSLLLSLILIFWSKILSEIKILFKPR